MPQPGSKSKYQGVDGAYYIVNPHGTVHSCDRDHAAGRLRQAGWRLATDGEIELYLETRVQRSGRPLARPWNPDPDGALAEFVPEVVETEDDEPEATEAARELAREHDIDLSEVEGTGAEGRILKADVEAQVEE